VDTKFSRKLKMLGMFLFLLGLITGFATVNLKNPRMGLAAHLEGLMNGTFLIVAGLIWNDLKLFKNIKTAAYWTLIYGTFVNWFVTLNAAYFGAYAMSPVTGHGFMGTPMQENFVNAGFISVGLTMVFSVAVMAYGLRGNYVLK
jgi:(hydroxyamino)benzene mutase